MNMISNSLRLGLLGMGASLAFGSLPAMAAPNMAHHGEKMEQSCGMGYQAGQISVNGHGESHIAPDIARIMLGVTTQGDTAALAMSENSSRQNAVIDALKASGVEAKDIQTSGLILNPVMDYPQDGGAPKMSGYRAQNMITVTVRKLENLGEVLDKIVGAGANELNGITFEHSDPAKAQDEARIAAVKNARHHAEVIAGAAEITLGRILTISDSINEMPQPMMRMESMAKASDANVPIEAGEIALTANIQVTFSVMPQDGGPCQMNERMPIPAETDDKPAQ